MAASARVIRDSVISVIVWGLFDVTEMTLLQTTPVRWHVKAEL